MKSLPCLLFLTCLGILCGAPPSFAAPAYTLVEAEAVPTGAVKADSGASGGRYVSQDGAYQLMIVTPLPAEGDAFTVWARVRGVAMQLKGVYADGSQHELNWEWDKPNGWKWVSFGKHTRAELGAKLLLMRAPDAAPNAGLDAVVITTDDTFTPERLMLALSIPPRLPIPVTVDWNKTVTVAGPFAYGLNAFRGFDPTVTANPMYQKNLAYMAPGLLRLHNAGMVGDSAGSADAWVDYAHRRWDAAKIGKALVGFPPGATLLINIPNWPSWMDADHDGFLDADQTDAYARFCADLVRIVNRDLKKHVVFWEVTNERDENYFVNFHEAGGWGPLKDPAKPDRVEELARIYAQCADAMKAVDPAIKVGGPAMERPDLAMFAERFARVAGPRLDFFSFHAYASGSRDDPDDVIFDHAAGFGGSVDAFRKALAAAVPGRTLPLFLDEYNVSYTWETRDPRMTDIKSAVFDALAMTSAVTHGAAGTAAWNEYDGIYGKMDGGYHLRPSATLFHLLNASMIGPVVSAASADPQSVVAYAVKTTRGRSLLLINRTGYAQSVTLTGWGSKPTAQSLLAPAGYAETELTLAQLVAPLPLPADSVTLLTQ